MSEKEVCELIKTNRGGIKLYINGYTYDKNRSVGNVYYWSCEMRRHNVYACRALANTTTDSENNHILTKTSHEHNHEPNPVRKKIADFKAKLRADVDATVKAEKVIQSNKDNLTPELLMHLPSTTSLRQLVYREINREKKNLRIEEPTGVDFEIDESQTKINDDNFIIKDRIYDGNKRILIMATLNTMTILSNSRYWIIDGVFKSIPSVLFKHFYTIHGSVLDDKKQTYPLLFCLCTHKDKQIYETMFELILEYAFENNITMKPDVCILDFDKYAQINCQLSFENTMLHGSTFHLAKIIYNYIQDQNYLKKYGSDMNFNTEVKCLLALSYLSEEEIPRYFNELLNTLQDPDSKHIAEWFGENFVGIYDKQPIFSPRFWSCVKLGSVNVPKVHSSAEAWHYKINAMIDKHQPGLYHFNRELIKETLANCNEIEYNRIDRLAKHTKQPAKKRKYSSKNEQIERILADKANHSEVKLLKLLAVHVNVL